MKENISLTIDQKAFLYSELCVRQYQLEDRICQLKAEKIFTNEKDRAVAQEMIDQYTEELDMIAELKTHF